MSKISMEFDTVTKKLTVMMDDKVIENVTDVSCYKMWSHEAEEGEEQKFSLRVAQMSEDKEANTVTYTHICASEINRQTFGSEFEEAVALRYADGV